MRVGKNGEMQGPGIARRRIMVVGLRACGEGPNVGPGRA